MRKFTGLLLFAVLCPLCLFALSTGLLAQEEITVTSTGLGVVIGGDLGKARDEALNDALRKAVEQAVGTMISSQSIVENAILIEDNIYSKTSGYIKGYDIVREGQSVNLPNTYEVALTATVSTASLKDDLAAIGILLQRKGLPRMMVIIEEKNIEQHQWVREAHNLNSAEQKVQEIFRNRGFDFVDQKTAFRNLKRDQEMAINRGDTQAAVTLGNRSGAEVVITGNAIAKKSSTNVDLGGMISIQANVNMRAIRTDNADIIATASASAPQVHIDDITGGVLAIQKASEKAAEQLSEQIIATWSEDLASGMRVNLIVHNLQSFGDLNDFKFVLRDYTRGTKSVDLRSFAAGVAEFDVETTSTANDMAQSLTTKDLEKFTVEVLGVTQNRLELEVHRK
jgi:hypothetical protein